MDLLITTFTSITSFVVSLAGDVIGLVVANPILLIGFAVGLLGSGIALYRKLK